MNINFGVIWRTQIQIINYTNYTNNAVRLPNKGTRTSPARLSFVLKVPLCNLCPSIIYSVPCDRILQRAYSLFTLCSPLLCRHILFIISPDYSLFLPCHLRTFAPIATAHLQCARYSLVTHVPRHFQARARSPKLNKI